MFFAKAQSPTLSLEWYTQMRNERALLDSLHKVHFDIKPFFSWDLDQYGSQRQPEKKLMSWTGDSYKFRVVPIAGLTPGFAKGQNLTSGFTYSVLGGARLEASIKEKFYLQVDGVYGSQNPPSYLASIYDSLTVVPGFGLDKNLGREYLIRQLGFAAAYRLSKNFTLVTGRGKNFLGEGYRSIYLSDFASNNNYLKLDVNVWKLRYQVIYNEYRHPANYPAATFPMTTKFATTHYMSLDLTKWWSVNAFETVVWANTSGAVSRGYDFSYLNPLIFFRPVEYGMGSADNSILGGGTTLRPARGMALYFNIVIDEFLFGEVIAPIRNFAAGDSIYPTQSARNKQGYQLGFKYHEPFQIKDASFIVEANTIRPYTFGHGSVVQSYTHMSQSLAHPLGANFVEYLIAATWQPNRWNFGFRGFYHRKGYTFSNYSMGEDPMHPLPDLNVQQRERRYGNFITQGHRQDVFNVILDAQYELVPEWDLRLIGSLHYRKVRSALPNQTTMISLGIQSCLWNTEQGL